MKRGLKKPAEVRAPPSKPGVPKEKTPRKGSQTKDQEGKLGQARKASPRPVEATQAPPSANEPGRKSKVKGRRSR